MDIKVIINSSAETIFSNLFILLAFVASFFLKYDNIMDINIAATPNIGADARKNKPKLKNKNPHLNILSSL